MENKTSRRHFLSTCAIVGNIPLMSWLAIADENHIDSQVIKNHDHQVEELLSKQVTNPDSKWRGAYPNRWGLHQPGSAGQILKMFSAAYLNSQSRFHQENELFNRMALAADFLERMQSPQGNIDLLTTNFNSPPDTAFVIHKVATAANLARIFDDNELLTLMEPFIRKAGQGIANGGIHTPNHRWVVCEALAQINELFPDPLYIQRINQWLAEGIDIDQDGQFTERSTTIYNAVCDKAFIVIAHKLKRPELLEPVRKNLDSMLYLLHPNYEVVTEISRRQDINTRGTMERFWLPLKYMAIHEKNGMYSTLVNHLEPQQIELSELMEYPILNQPLPSPVPVPKNYKKYFPAAEITRIRHGLTSATLIHNGNSRFFSLRRNEAVINAVRFATAFFGKGQFVPARTEKRGDSYFLSQKMAASYYQPLNPSQKVPATREGWHEAKQLRRQSEICHLEQKAIVTEQPNGFTVRISAEGTDNIPLAVEINLREGSKIEGCEPVKGVDETYLLKSGMAVCRMGNDTIRFGPGTSVNQYTHVRGAQPKLPGPSVYLTGYTPFDHTLTVEWT